MALSFFETARFKLRALKGANLVADIDAGFEALASDIDAILYKSGDLRLTARAALDEGWLACDGSEKSRATFKALFEAIGTTYGAGNGATTFNIPDYRGRSPVGAGAGSGLTNRVLGTKGGEETHTLTSGELAEHGHLIQGEQNGGAGGSVVPHFSKAVTADATFVGNIADHTTGLANRPKGEAHNNMQPYEVCNVWIKT